MSQLLIGVVGHNASGKSTVAKRLARDLQINRVSGDDLRQFVSEKVAYFNNLDISYPNNHYNELNPLIIDFRLGLTRVLLQAGETVLFDGSGASRAHRQKYLSLADNKVITILLHVQIEEPLLLGRLATRDQSSGGSWRKQYLDVKQFSFEPPTADEADHLLIYDQANYEGIKQKLLELMS